MALSKPRTIFGVHSVSPYNRTTGIFYGEMRVLKGSSLTLEGESIKLTGGASKYPWGAEDGLITSELTLKFSEYHDFVFELFLGKAVTTNVAETSGNVATLTNKKGTSVVASTGIASVAAITTTGPANLKFGRYVVVAVSATTVDVYHSSDIDHARGSNGSYTTDTLKIFAAQAISTGADTNLTTFGLKLVGGAGTIGMTTGDTATFEVRPINTGSISVRVGSATDSTFPEFGLVVYAQRKGNQELVELDLFKVKAAGAPINFDQNAWSEAEVKCEVLYDEDKDGIFDLIQVKAT